MKSADDENPGQVKRPVVFKRTSGRLVVLPPDESVTLVGEYIYSSTRLGRQFGD